MNNEESEGAHFVVLTLSSLPINLHRCTVHPLVAASFAFPGTTCILFPILRLLTGSELMWNNALVIWDGAAVALAGRQFLPATFPETFPMRRPSNTRRPAIHSGEGASTRERVFALSNNFDGLLDGVRAGRAQWQWAVNFESHSWRERETTAVRWCGRGDRRASAVIVELPRAT